VNAHALEKVGASLAVETSVGLTQEMVRIDSTNGPESGTASEVVGRRQSLE